MALMHAIHDKENPYVMANKSIADDSRLSYKAIGIWFYAFSKPHDWKFYKNDLIKRHSDGRDSVESGLKELEENGYLYKYRVKNNDGQFDGWEYVFFEKAKTQEEIQKMFPKHGFSVDRVSPTSGKPVPIVNNDLKLKKENNNRCRFPCLDKLDSTDAFKNNVMQQKKDDGTHYAEEEVERAVRVTKNAKPICEEAFFTDCLRNPDKYVEKTNIEDSQRKNKGIAVSLVKNIDKNPYNAKIEVLNTFIEIGSGVHEPACINYDSKDFIHHLRKTLKKWKITTKITI